MSTDSTEKLQKRIDALEKQVSRLKRGRGGRNIRKRSSTTVMGLPLYDIAMGADPARGERCGHARGFIAIGDIATGVLAMGGIARGVIAFGGVAIGGVSLGGCSIAVLAGFGGLAVGALAAGGLALGLVAIGGGAVGVVAIGGGAVGYYACGGGAFGQYVLSGSEQNPEAVNFFKQWLPGIRQLILPPPR